ncbi:Predicted dehydrogenase [Ruaniaceae bacterium KH17]|nr:Predicted dehydrogenase [Ruaniaceae bacterium KH17]
MLRTGIVGTNFISEWFIEAARNTDGRVDPVTVYSRSADRAAEFASAHGVPTHVSEYAALLDVVDLVYVASPTSAHFPQAMAAIEAGKHVLVEKTITANHEQAVRLFTAAEAAGVVVMEATRHLHIPEFAVIRDAIERLGTVRYARFEQQQYSSRYDRFRAGEHVNAFDPTLGNSALVDIGVYGLQPLLDFFGEPRAHTGVSVRLDNGFDAAGSLTLDYGSMVADIVYSKIAQGYSPCVIVGERGELAIDSPSEPSRVTLRTREGETAIIDHPRLRPAETMHHELNAFADQVEEGAINPRWRDVSIASRKIIDEHLARTAVDIA